MRKLILVAVMCTVAQSCWAFGSFNKTKSAPGMTTTSAGNTNTVVTPIPEPETYLLLLTGLGLVAWVAHKRKK